MSAFQETAMFLTFMPAPGDVVIRANASDQTPRYVLSCSPGPAQFGCATRAEVERMARAYATHAGVSLWFSDGPGLFARLPALRAETRRTPQRGGIRASGFMPAPA